MTTQSLFSLKGALRRSMLKTLKAMPDIEIEQQCECICWSTLALP